MDSPFVLVVEQLIANPTEGFFTSTLWSFGMGVQEMGTELHKQPGPVGNALAQYLDAEVIGLEDEPIPAACAMRQDLRAQPVRAVHRIDFVGLLSSLFLSFKLLMELITELYMG
jgi:hypothetical protein